MVLSTIQRLGKTGKALRGVGSLDDLHADLPEDTLQGALELGSLISAIGIELEQEWEPAEQGCHPQNAAITILDICRVNDRVQQ